jgi:hypothetical protein
MKTKNNISHTPPKNKTSQHNDIGINDKIDNLKDKADKLKKIFENKIVKPTNKISEKIKNSTKDVINSNIAKNIGLSIGALLLAYIFGKPIGLALILFQNRKTISKKLKPHWDEWVKKTGVIAQIEKCANKRYVESTPVLLRKYRMERRYDPKYQKIFRKCTKEHWEKHKKTNEL